MDLNLTPTELKFRDELRAWLKANVPTDWEKHRTEDEMLVRFEYLRAWQKKVYQAGWAGIAWPKEYGGRGATLMQQVIFIEEMTRASAPPLANVLGLSLIGPTIIAFGTDCPEKALPGEHPQRRRDLVPGFLGAQRRIAISPTSAPTRAWTAITTSSTGRRCGTAMVGRPTGALC